MEYFKIKNNFFDSNKIKAIRSCKNGDVTVLVYLMLVAIAVNCDNDGAVMLCDDMALTEKMMSVVLSMPSVTITEALKQLIEFGFIRFENDVYRITDYDDFICTDKVANKRKQGAERQRKYVERKKSKQVDDTQITMGADIAAEG